MPNQPLSLFSYEILGLIGESGAGPHDLRQMVRRGRILDWAGESQYYAEPKRLAQLGYLSARKEPGRTRERTVYNLSPRGREALESWAETPTRFTPFKSEALIRMLVADIVGESLTRESIGRLREDIADLRAQLEEMQSAAARLPHRSKYLMLSVSLLRGLLELHSAWIDEVERVLEP